MTGWPFEVPADFACPATDQCSFSILDIEPSGGVYLTSQGADEQRVIAIDARAAT